LGSFGDFFDDLSGVAFVFTLSTLASPRLRFKIAKKLGLTINAKNSNLATAPSIGSKIP